MMDLDRTYDVFTDMTAIRLAEIVKRRFYHVLESTNEPKDKHQYELTSDGLIDLEGELVAKWDGDDLVRLTEVPARFRLVPRK